LLYEEHPEPVALKGTIKRLRDEVESLRAQLTSNSSPKQDKRAALGGRESEVDRLREENDALQEELQNLQRGDWQGVNGHMGGEEKQIADLQNQLDKVKKERGLLQAKLDKMVSLKGYCN
jgi:chromosome segregation ATPase